MTEKYKTLLIKAGEPSLNGNVYPKKALKNAIEKSQLALAQGKLLGVLYPRSKSMVSMIDWEKIEADDDYIVMLEPGRFVEIGKGDPVSDTTEIVRAAISERAAESLARMSQDLMSVILRLDGHRDRKLQIWLYGRDGTYFAESFASEEVKDMFRVLLLEANTGKDDTSGRNLGRI